MEKNESVRKLEDSLHEEGDPVPADQDEDDSDGKEQVDQEFSGRNFSPGGLKLYHFSILFVTQGFDRVCQSGPQGMVAN